MNLVVLDPNPTESAALKEIFLNEEIDICKIAGTIAEARQEIMRLNACCLVFDRAFAEDFSCFCEHTALAAGKARAHWQRGRLWCVLWGLRFSAYLKRHLIFLQRKKAPEFSFENSGAYCRYVYII